MTYTNLYGHKLTKTAFATLLPKTLFTTRLDIINNFWKQIILNIIWTIKPLNYLKINIFIFKDTTEKQLLQFKQMVGVNNLGF